MKKTVFSLFFLLIILSFNHLTGQYTPVSNYILQPELNIEYVKNNAAFWMKSAAFDAVNGGFYSAVNRDGSLRDTNQKSFIVQSRHGYGFTRAFMLTGDETYLTYANSALNFLTAHGWDTTNDGWYYFGNANGSLDNRIGWNPNTTKNIFQQHYGLAGIIANYEATHNSTFKTWMDKGINSLYNHAWDSRAGYEGYYETAATNWTGKTGKGFTGTIDGITTNAELTYLITKSATSKTRLFQLADIIVNKIIPTMSDSKVKVLYPESFSSNWVPDYTQTTGSIGHFIKTAWCLGRAYLCDTTKTQYKIAASKILDEVWTYDNNAGVTIWDHVNGGPFNQLDITTGGWTTTNGDNKDYWTLEQGFTGPMINYYITQNPIYLQMADESINFFMNYQVDAQYGEIFSELDPTGLITRNDRKGDDFKASYHSIEMGYYAYLYSSLYYLHQPASLYYKFPATNTVQNIALTPIPIQDNRLIIKNVTLDGIAFNNFDAQTRTLNIPANQGGKFKVTFDYVGSLTEATATKENLVYTYPNPVIDVLSIAGAEKISQLTITDLAGKTLVEFKNNQSTLLRIDFKQFKAGIYILTSHKLSGEITSQKIIKK